MAELLTAEQMRAVEGTAITSGEVTGLELMERAGMGVVAAVFQQWPELGTSAQRVSSSKFCGLIASSTRRRCNSIGAMLSNATMIAITQTAT